MHGLGGGYSGDGDPRGGGIPGRPRPQAQAGHVRLRAGGGHGARRGVGAGLGGRAGGAARRLVRVDDVAQHLQLALLLLDLSFRVR